MKWRVEQILEPNKFDTFLLLSREIDNMIHPDSKVIPIDMVVIDIYNEEFCPDTKKVRKIMAQIKEHEAAIQQLTNAPFVLTMGPDVGQPADLNEIWLAMFDHSV